MISKFYQGLKRTFSARMRHHIVLATGILLLFGLVTACQQSATNAPQPTQTAEKTSGYAGKKILWVNAYNDTYEWSKEIETGIKTVLEGTGIEFKTVQLDSQNVPDEALKATAEEINAEIDAFKPDVVIASDDSSQQYVVVPYLKGRSTPVVFCGVNWDASGYGYPADNVTGMIEVDLIVQLVEHLKNYAKGERIGYLSADITTEQKNAVVYQERFFDGKLNVNFVKTFDEFKDLFVKLQSEVDMLYIGNNPGIEGWDNAEAERFILENARIPSGSLHDWMAPYVLITMPKKGEEQGEWAAQTALQIIDGTPVSDIEITQNKKGDLILNLDLAEKLGIVFAPSMLKSAETYTAEE